MCVRMWVALALLFPIIYYCVCPATRARMRIVNTELGGLPHVRTDVGSACLAVCCYCVCPVALALLLAVVV